MQYLPWFGLHMNEQVQAIKAGYTLRKRYCVGSLSHMQNSCTGGYWKLNITVQFSGVMTPRQDVIGSVPFCKGLQYFGICIFPMQPDMLCILHDPALQSSINELNLNKVHPEPWRLEYVSGTALYNHLLLESQKMLTSL